MFCNDKYSFVELKIHINMNGDRTLEQFLKKKLKNKIFYKSFIKSIINI